MYDFDLIVIGSGAGGGTLAAQCGSAGRSVLLLERGAGIDHSERARESQANVASPLPYDDRQFSVNGQEKQLVIGGHLGGGTSVFGAALLRPSNEDFHPGSSYGDKLDRSIWDWPISYESLKNFYDEGEKIYRVASSPMDDYHPLNSPNPEPRDAPLDLVPINQRLVASSQKLGLRPLRLPLAINSKTCLRCADCAAFPCPNRSRRSSYALVQEAISQGNRLEVKSKAQVLRLVLDGKQQVAGVEVLDRQSGVAERYSARRYVLAAGAIGTAAILLKSGITHPMLGRNFMYHYSPVAVGIFGRSVGGDKQFIKQLGFADFYLGTSELKAKMGIVQSLPVPSLGMLRQSGFKRMPRFVLNQLRRRMVPLAGTIEDLPVQKNRVSLDHRGEPQVEHQFHVFDKLRGKHLLKEMGRILRAAGALGVHASTIGSTAHVGHQCGTVRFGRDPRFAVADADGRIFGVSNLFVADGSLFPTSLGVGPALTIIANALRIARVISQEI